MTYRADIDGLRALAVTSVLLFHAGTPGFPGGFVGVDIFFVISGYLICGMLDAQLRAGTLSLGTFYKRRVMRIVPALAVMMLVVSAVAYRDFLPVELRDYAFSLAAAAASVSNMYFAFTAGYFDAPALTKPLLHTWSLGVEEQFYIVVPLLMMLVARFASRHMRAALVFAAALSLILAVLAAKHSPDKAFYLAPFRAWEFLLGALLAVGSPRVVGATRFRDGMGLLGLAAILGAVLFGSSETPFIVMTGLASVGAVTIIASTSGEGARSIVGRLLALWPFRWVGLISYSVYLWHWPIIVFARSDAFLASDLPHGAVQAIVIALSLAAGTVSWWFVELPFRAATPRIPGRIVFGAASAATFALCGFGVLLAGLEGVPSRFPPQVVRLASYLAYDPGAAFRQGRCYLDNDRESLDEAMCLHVASDRPNYLLMGDSFAAHLWLGLSRALPNVNVLQASMGQCRPVVIAAAVFDSGACTKLRNRLFGMFLEETKVDRVLLAAAWKDKDIAPLLSTLDALRARGLDVTVLGPLVEYDQPLPRLLADEILRNDPSIARRMRDASIPVRDQTMRALVTARGATYVSLYDAACPGDICQELTQDGVPVQFDTGHLTAEGSIVIAQRLAANFTLHP